eukprot:131723-Chlamydomonas_euryale.AAC.3
MVNSSPAHMLCCSPAHRHGRARCLSGGLALPLTTNAAFLQLGRAAYTPGLACSLSPKTGHAPARYPPHAGVITRCWCDYSLLVTDYTTHRIWGDRCILLKHPRHLGMAIPPLPPPPPQQLCH